MTSGDPTPTVLEPMSVSPIELILEIGNSSSLKYKSGESDKMEYFYDWILWIKFSSCDETISICEQGKEQY